MKSAAKPDARSAALAALTACFGPKRLDLQAALDGVLSQPGLDPRDIALTTELAYGYSRLKARADFTIDLHLKDPSRLHPDARRILGLAAFELSGLDKTPAYAIVNWAVAAVKRSCGQKLGNLANAVLRRIADLGRAPREAAFYWERTKSEQEYLALYYSCPDWIIARLTADLGQEQARLVLAAQLAKPPLGLRANTARKESRAAFDRLAAGGSLYARFPTLALGPHHRPGPRLKEMEAEGLISRHAAASQRIIDALDPGSWPGPVLDACAGRGGKTCMLLEAGIPLMAASDLNFARLAGLRGEIARLGLARIPLVRARADKDIPWRRRPGTILLDAPCSGLGVLSRRPDLKWKRIPGDVAKLAALQAKMLASAYHLLPGGGHLVYVTCTLTSQENQERVSALTRAFPGSKLLAMETTPPDSGLGEFFFGAVIKKGG